MTGVLIQSAELGGALVADVRVAGAYVVEIGERLRPRRDETVIDAGGAAVLPGLHDHHLHVLSLAASSRSVWCGPPEVVDLAGLARALRAAPPGWVRGIGYHETVGGVLDRDMLDRMVADQPVRIQHRGGALWVLNSRALSELRLRDEPGVETDDAGRPTGRLWRADPLLRERLGDQPPPDLATVGRRLASLGITGITDATPNLTHDTVALLAEAVTSGVLPQRLHLLGAPTGARLPPRISLGPHKILRPDHEAPDWDKLRTEVALAHANGRPTAIHAVTRESLVVSLAVLAEIGTLAGDRIEHAAVVDEDLLPLLAATAPVVVTQPGFIAERGEEYRREIPAAEHDDLYRYATLLAAGVRVVPSSDAPFASEDPWRTIAAATHRRTPHGVVLGPAERVAPEQALSGLLAPLEAPGGPARRIQIGAPADLCLLRVSLAEALRAPDAELVSTTICAGEMVFRAGL